MTLFIGTGLEAGLRRARGATAPASGAPRLLHSPVLLGSGRIGELVEVDPGAWAGAETLSFAWLRDDVPIPGAVEATYAPSADDDRALLACRVTAENAAGQTEARTRTITIRPPQVRPASAFLHIRYTQFTGPHTVIESPFFQTAL